MVTQNGESEFAIVHLNFWVIPPKYDIYLIILSLNVIKFIKQALMQKIFSDFEKKIIITSLRHADLREKKLTSAVN